MTQPTAQVHVTKLAAAQRQLRAAIRLFFLEEDELAVHTVASAAYRLIADLKAERGMNEAADIHLMSLFYVIRDYRRGSLPKHITDNAEGMGWLASVAEQLPISADTRIDEISAIAGKDATKRFWQKQNKASNFLKHADLDPSAYLSVNDVDNYLLLMQALSSYTDLVKGDLGDEGIVLWVYAHAEDGDVDRLPEKFRSIGERIAGVPREKRRGFCRELIQARRADAAK